MRSVPASISSPSVPCPAGGQVSGSAGELNALFLRVLQKLLNVDDLSVTGSIIPMTSVIALPFGQARTTVNQTVPPLTATRGPTQIGGDEIVATTPLTADAQAILDALSTAKSTHQLGTSQA